MVFETFNIEPPSVLPKLSRQESSCYMLHVYTSTTAGKHARVYIAPAPLPDAISKTKHRYDAKGIPSLNV